MSPTLYKNTFVLVSNDYLADGSACLPLSAPLRVCAWLCVHECVIPPVFVPQRYPRWREMSESAVCVFLPATDSSCQSVSLAYCHLSFGLSLSLSLCLSLSIHPSVWLQEQDALFFFFAELVLWVEDKHWKKKKKTHTHLQSITVQRQLQW